MQKTKNKRPLHRSERYRILGYERDKAALLQAARSMSAAEYEQRLIELANKWKI